MYKRASRRSGASQIGHGMNAFGQWKWSSQQKTKMHSLAQRLVRAASKKSSREEFVSSLTDFWLTDALRQLIEANLLKLDGALSYWTTVPPRHEEQGRQIQLSPAERREGELVMLSKLKY